MLHLELPTWLLHSGQWPTTVAIQPNGHVIAEFMGDGDSEYRTWTSFCGQYDGHIAPDILFDELKDQIDPDVLALAERGGHDIDEVVRFCGECDASTDRSH